jgi:hypothetical protein
MNLHEVNSKLHFEYHIVSYIGLAVNCNRNIFNILVYVNLILFTFFQINLLGHYFYYYYIIALCWALAASSVSKSYKLLVRLLRQAISPRKASIYIKKNSMV